MRILALAVLLAATGASAEDGGPPSPGSDLRGRVLLDGTSRRVGMPAVTFDHWRHRLFYSCRVCHVDLGFAMKAGETQISAAGNETGQHCGACHDGKLLHDGTPIFRACFGWPRADPARGCTRCHTGPTRGPGAGYEELRQALPADVAGDIDWAAAAGRGLIRPADVVEGISPRRAALKIDRDVALRTSGTWMSDVTFSHKRHVAWVACELCHPEIFPVTKRGSVRFDMADLRAGRYCGVCHLKVAFPLTTCVRCHAGQDRRFLR